MIELQKDSIVLAFVKENRAQILENKNLCYEIYLLPIVCLTEEYYALFV